MTPTTPSMEFASKQQSAKLELRLLLLQNSERLMHNQERFGSLTPHMQAMPMNRHGFFVQAILHGNYQGVTRTGFNRWSREEI